MEKNEKKIWFVNISEYHHRTMELWLDKSIYKTKMKFRAVLGRQGCREKNPPNFHKSATFWDVFKDKNNFDFFFKIP